jgi:hypothetical protein
LAERLALKVPLGQTAQLVRPVAPLDEKPAGQASQEDCPACPCAVPSPHSVHSLARVTENVPGRQVLQAAVSPALNVPGEQSTQSVLRVSRLVRKPGPQVVQLLSCAVVEYLPDGQGRHELCRRIYVPGEHWPQDVPSMANLPAVHCNVGWTNDRRQARICQ